jgi:hypothetical protein
VRIVYWIMPPPPPKKKKKLKGREAKGCKDFILLLKPQDFHPLIFKEAWQFRSQLFFSFQAKKCLTLWIT